MISLFLLFAVFFSCIPIQAQEETEESAEINANIKGEIPSIKLTEWTPINISIKDAFGIPWEELRTGLLPIASKLGLYQLNVIYMNVVWGLNPTFPQPVSRFFGYTKLRFEPEIVQGDPRGWYLKVTPNFIPKANTDWNYNISLEARVDDSAVDYSVVVGIKSIRIDTEGGEIGSTYIYVPLKASPTNYVKMNVVQTKKNAGPKSMVYFTFDITNEGYYKDVFQFELEEENGLLALANEQAITLNPGETRAVTIGVLTPEKLWDPGTPNKIDVKIYSIGDPSKTLVGSLTVYTGGIYISPLVLLILAPIILFLIIIYLIFFYLKEKRYRNIVGKPDKPWTIPEERRHLEKLKQRNREEFEQERLLMEHEYKSAMLWYKSYLNAFKRLEKTKINRFRFGGFLTKIYKKPKKEEKTEKKKIIDKKKPKKETRKFTEFLQISKKKKTKNKKKNKQNIITQLLQKPKPKKKKVNKKKQKKDKQNIITQLLQKPKPKKKKVEKTKDIDQIKIKEIEKKAEEQRYKEKLLLQIKKDQEKQLRQMSK